MRRDGKCELESAVSWDAEVGESVVVIWQLMQYLATSTPPNLLNSLSRLCDRLGCTCKRITIGAHLIPLSILAAWLLLLCPRSDLTFLPTHNGGSHTHACTQSDCGEYAFSGFSSSAHAEPRDSLTTIKPQVDVFLHRR